MHLILLGLGLISAMGLCLLNWPFLELWDKVFNKKYRKCNKQEDKAIAAVKEDFSDDHRYEYQLYKNSSRLIISTYDIDDIYIYLKFETNLNIEQVNDFMDKIDPLSEKEEAVLEIYKVIRVV